MPTNVNIASGDYTHALQKRQLGKFNIGFYCTNCTEFVAVVVQDAGMADRLKKEVTLVGGPISFVCPFCQHRQERELSEAAQIVLTEGNKRRPPISRSAH